VRLYSLDEVLEHYVFSDGRIVSMSCDYLNNSILVSLDLRKRSEGKLVPAKLSVRFIEVFELDVVEHFSTSGQYSDIVLQKGAEGDVYASFDPIDNSGKASEGDNFIIRAKSCEFFLED
jgi:hypothetical protein